jgi:hypothetical protein
MRTCLVAVPRRSNPSHVDPKGNHFGLSQRVVHYNESLSRQVDWWQGSNTDRASCRRGVRDAKTAKTRLLRPGCGDENSSPASSRCWRQPPVLYCLAYVVLRVAP